MKKLIYGAAIALALSAVSCGKSGDSDSAYFSKQATDSLVESFGTAVGYGLNRQITTAMLSDSTLTKEAFLKGLQYGMACDTADAYMNGVITGLQIQTQLKRYSRMGINVDPSVAVNSFKTAFLADSLPDHAALAEIDARYRRWTDSLTNAEHAYKIRMIEETPESKENVANGDAFIKIAKEQNDSVKISDSGLAYKIINEGAADKVDVNGRARIKYIARNIDGKVVDLHSGTAPIQVSSRMPGFKEGVSMLGNGGKAVLYVPGRLAYGAEAPSRLNIGPNELLIYDIEVIDVAPEDK